MAVDPSYPYPIPTPYQPQAQGGSGAVPVGTEGPAIGNAVAPDTGTFQTYPTTTTTPTTTPVVTPTPTTTQPSGAPPYSSNTEGQTVTYNGQTFKADGKGGWVSQGSGTPGIDEAAINNVYEPTMNYLNQAESAVRQDFPNVLDAAQKQYETAIAELSGNKQKNATTIGENVITATTRKEDALSAARRLYDELRRGYQQRFGGSTSAGQAASELSAVEQQRQMGQTTRDFGTTMRQIDAQKAQLETDYQTGSMKILESKTTAISQANRDFQNQLLTIAGQRAQTESAKAAAKLDALNTLRNDVYTAQQAALQNQTMLDNYKKQQDMDIQTYVQKLQLSGQGSASAISSFLGQTTTNPTSSLQATSSNGQNTALTGQIKKPEDAIANAAGSIGFNKPVSGYGSYDPYKLGL